MVVRDLTAVLDDGTPYGEGVPRNSRQLLRLPLRSDIRVRVRFISRSGAAIALDWENDTVRLTSRLKPDGDVLLSVDGAEGDRPEVAVFDISADDSGGTSFGNALFDVWLRRGETVEPAIPLSPLVWEPAVTDL